MELRCVLFRSLYGLCLHPKLLHFLQGDIFPLQSLSCDLFLDMPKPRHKPAYRLAQGVFRTNLNKPSDIDKCKQEVPKLALHPLTVPALECLLKFTHLLLNLCKDLVNMLPVKPDP